jgi:hypothetical protein
MVSLWFFFVFYIFTTEAQRHGGKESIFHHRGTEEKQKDQGKTGS